MRLFVGNYKGPKGEQGPQGQKGNTGDIGQRGSRCTSGTSVTGTSTTGTIFASTGITDSLLHDFYINTSTGNLYECTVPGPADVAKWTYICNIKGPTGATGPAGPTGSISDINNQKPTYTEAATLANISSGETVKIAFGKLKKAISVLMTHYTQQATAAVLGHVKLSNSAAVTQTGLMALDAVEKNAAIAGTLANQISQANSKLQIQIYDFVTNNPFTNGTTYRFQENNWMAVNKIYKIGRICWLALDVDLRGVTIGSDILNIANVPDEFGPLSILSTENPDEYDTGFYPGGNLIFVAHRNTEKYPNWSDLDPVRFNFVYFSKE